jgi:hypothetical protein
MRQRLALWIALVLILPTDALFAARPSIAKSAHVDR